VGQMGLVAFNRGRPLKMTALEMNTFFWDGPLKRPASVNQF
jgi:hypothetical protein